VYTPVCKYKETKIDNIIIGTLFLLVEISGSHKDKAIPVTGRGGP
jgi:hypothetical protein